MAQTGGSGAKELKSSLISNDDAETKLSESNLTSAGGNLDTEAGDPLVQDSANKGLCISLISSCFRRGERPREEKNWKYVVRLLCVFTI